jgi:Dullard-like phosphatase family protein
MDTFLKKMSKLYEIIFYTASVKVYANLVIDYIDPDMIGTSRLFRDHCKQIEGSFVKDLENIGRDLKKTIIIDNSPIAYCLHPNNGLPIKSFYDDIDDRELLNIMPILEYLADVDDVQVAIKNLVDDLFINQDKGIHKRVNSNESKMSKSSKYQSISVEDNKREFDHLDLGASDLKLEEMDESHSSELVATRAVSRYKSSKRSKPSAMLARYNESTLKKSNDQWNCASTDDQMQIG